MSTQFKQLILEVPDVLTAELEELLLECGVLGLETEDDETRSIPDKAPVVTGRALLKATFPDDPQIEQQIDSLLADVLVAVGEEESSIRWQTLEPKDWVHVYETHYPALSIEDKIWIVPSWEKQRFVAPDSKAIVVDLDPGMAFGTGHHETTALCAGAIYDIFRDPSNAHGIRVLDVGTGTGLLAILAVKMGAQLAVGTDNDETACAAARENSEKNGVQDRLSILNLEPDAFGPIFHVVVANILAQPLIDMAEVITRALIPGGTLLLSGVLDMQSEAVCAAYKKAGLFYQRTVIKNGWCLIEAQKPLQTP